MLDGVFERVPYLFETKYFNKNILQLFEHFANKLLDQLVLVKCFLICVQKLLSPLKHKGFTGVWALIIIINESQINAKFLVHFSISCICLFMQGCKSCNTVNDSK